MADELEDVFGEDLAQHVRQKTAQRRQERNRVTDEQMALICSEAINEDRFGEGDPQFQYTTENNLTHTAILMQVPEPNNGTVWQYLDEPWDGAASLPLDYLGEWMSVTFTDKDDLKKLDAGDWCVVVGEIRTFEKRDGTTGEGVTCRGVATLQEAKEYASSALDDEGFDDETSDEDPFAEPSGSDEVVEDEPEEAEVEDEQEDHEDEFSGFDEPENEEDDEAKEPETESISYDDVSAVVEQLADKEPAVWEVEDGDPRLERLVEVVSNKLDIDNPDGVAETIITVINDHNEQDEEEDDEDGFDQLF